MEAEYNNPELAEWLGDQAPSDSGTAVAEWEKPPAPAAEHAAGDVRMVDLLLSGAQHEQMLEAVRVLRRPGESCSAVVFRAVMQAAQQ